eukprot:TRINITY_DN8644_c0_g1_i1.p1 TRINITY_DN8644_c0_g1~~TRINITY_DN8644_c0_g1_i1.p1  ORF type:complete len:344 (-),score=73.58 TRINITY_DN8644_c0_g1_i1:155-1186(-)
MVLEATFLCVDNSEYMRNGDLSPTRMGAVHEACNLVVGAKTQHNPENTVGLLTLGGKNVEVKETLTSNLGRMLAALSTISISGDVHFMEGVQIAALGLKHRQNKQQRQRIIVFVGSPVMESTKQLETLGKKLKKNSVAIDVVAFGIEENIPKLEQFVAAANSQENSHLINVPLGVTLADVLVSSPIVAEEGAAAAGGGEGFEFGVDPATDPELAMVLRMSMEEEQRRLEAEQRAAGEGQASGGVEPAVESAAPMNEDEMTEEEMLAMAMKMSLGETVDAPPPPAPAPTNAPMTEEEEMEAALRMSMNPETEAGVDEVMNDPAYMEELAKGLGVDPSQKKDEGK